MFLPYLAKSRLLSPRITHLNQSGLRHFVNLLPMSFTFSNYLFLLTCDEWTVSHELSGLDADKAKTAGPCRSLFLRESLRKTVALLP